MKTLIAALLLCIATIASAGEWTPKTQRDVVNLCLKHGHDSYTCFCAIKGAQKYMEEFDARNFLLDGNKDFLDMFRVDEKKCAKSLR
jgi:hypothetical protein